MTQKGNHCAYSCHYHIAFPVKYRKALLSDRIAQSLKEISEQLSLRYEFVLSQIGTNNDHIYLLASIYPKYSIEQFVRLYKSITAKQLFLKFPELKKDLWGGEFWIDGYYVATVGERGTWKIVEQYFKNQGTKKHEVGPLTLW